MNKVVFRAVNLALMFTILAGSALYAQNKEVNPKGLLDFWVGNWEASWDEGDGKLGLGSNRIEKTLDGTVIHENFEVIEGGSKGFKGTSISVYQTTTKKWRQSWADNQGYFYCFTGDLEGDRKIFQTPVFETKNGKKVTLRMVFHHITDKTMIWDWESSNDGGKNWKLNWQINYKRKK